MLRHGREGRRQARDDAGEDGPDLPECEGARGVRAAEASQPQGGRGVQASAAAVRSGGLRSARETVATPHLHDPGLRVYEEVEGVQPRELLGRERKLVVLSLATSGRKRSGRPFPLIVPVGYTIHISRRFTPRQLRSAHRAQRAGDGRLVGVLYPEHIMVPAAALRGNRRRCGNPAQRPPEA